MKSRRSGREVKSSKDLARWSPGVMNMISRALLEQVFEEEVSMKEVHGMNILRTTTFPTGRTAWFVRRRNKKECRRCS